MDDTTLVEIDTAWRAKELEVFLYAQAQAELQLAKMSAVSLGETDDTSEMSDEQLQKRAQKQEGWRRRGEEIKAEIREALMFSLMPEHLKAAYVEMHGWPGEDGPREIVVPLEGVSRRVAQSLLGLITAQTFSRGPWVKNKLWQQLRADDALARARLEASADQGT